MPDSSFGGFFISPDSMALIVLGERLAALAICAVVEPLFRAAEIARLAPPPVFLPAEPFAIFLPSIVNKPYKYTLL